MNHRIRIVIQARIGSSRFQGKIMAPLAGKPMLAHVVGRLSQSANADSNSRLLVATTTDPQDDLTESLCEALGVECFRGPAQDVLARYVLATADLDEHDLIVRATADNPLYCPERARRIIVEHVRHAADYTHVEGLSYVVPEVIRAGALRAMAQRASDSDCREHVTPYFRRHKHDFVTHTLPENWTGLRPDIRLTVDTPAELRRLNALYDRLGESNSAAPLEFLYSTWDETHLDRSQEPALPTGSRKVT